MENTVRWQERFEIFCRKLSQLETTLQKKDFSDLEKDGVIKRFEFTFELAWKTLQDKLNDEGYIDIKGPKPVIKQSFQDGTIANGQKWIEMFTDRNSSSHSYDESAAQEIFDRIQTNWFKLLTDLKKKLQE